MQDIWTVARFTFLERARKKSFLILTAVLMAVIVLAAALVGFFTGGEDQQPGVTQPGETEKTSSCIWIDDGNILSLEAHMKLRALNPTVDMVTQPASDLEMFQQRIKENSSCSVIVVSLGDKGFPQLTVYTADFTRGMPIIGAEDAVRECFVTAAFENAGISSDMKEVALSGVNVTTVMLGTRDMTGYILGMLLTMVMFFAIYFYGYGVAMSVASEKTSRVMETLVVSAKPSRILVGKCIAMGLLGLGQLLVLLLTAGISIKMFLPEVLDFGGGIEAGISSLDPGALALVLVYFLLGYTLFSMISSVCGATVSRAEELQMAMMPSALISVASFYSAYIVTLTPGGGGAFGTAVTYIPFTAPFVMPSRLLNGMAAPGEVIWSLAALAAGIALVTWLSIRLYTASVLHYGERIRLKDLWRISR